MDRQLDEGVIKDLRNVLAQAEKVLKQTADSTGNGVSTARAKLEEALGAARESVGRLEGEALDRLRDGAAASDRYVRQHPWQSVGIAGAVGLVLGMLISRR